MNNTMSNNLHEQLLNFIENYKQYDQTTFKLKAKEIFEKFYESEMIFNESEEAEYLKDKNEALEKDDTETLNELKEFEECRSSILWICKNIENTNLEDDKVKEKFDSVYVFLKKMNSGLNELNETMKEMNNTLKNVTDTLSNYVNDIVCANELSNITKALCN